MKSFEDKDGNVTEKFLKESREAAFNTLLIPEYNPSFTVNSQAYIDICDELIQFRKAAAYQEALDNKIAEELEENYQKQAKIWGNK